MNINHLSVSRSQVWFECQQKYKYRYHLELPSLEEQQPYFLYGKVVHKIIELYTKNKGIDSIDKVIRQVLSGEIELEKGVKHFTVQPDYLKRLPDEMGAFLKLYSQIGSDGMIEYAFNYDLDPPNRKILTGFMDRVIFTGDKIFIIDYKTTRKSKFRKTARNITEDLQLRAYAMVASEQFDIAPENVKVALYYLDGAELVAAKFTKSTLMETKAMMLQVYDDIVASVPEKVVGTSGWHCKRCDYHKACPFYKKY